MHARVYIWALFSFSPLPPLSVSLSFLICILQYLLPSHSLTHNSSISAVSSEVFAQGVWHYIHTVDPLSLLKGRSATPLSNTHAQLHHEENTLECFFILLEGSGLSSKSNYSRICCSRSVGGGNAYGCMIVLAKTLNSYSQFKTQALCCQIVVR